MISVEEFAGDMEHYIDHAKTRRPGRESNGSMCDFPVDLPHAIDRAI
jgi:hypothetical protein